MPNPNYEAGRRLEFERRKFYEDAYGCTCYRSAGSHGPVDVTCIRPGEVMLLQLKRVSSPAEARLLIRRFKESPPFGHEPPKGVLQRLEGRVKGSKEILSATV